MRRLWITAGIVCWLMVSSWAQEHDIKHLAPKEDTVYVKAGHYVQLYQSFFFVPRDTIFVLQPGTQFEVLHNEKSYSFFDSLEEKLDRRRWTSRLHDLLIRSTPEQSTTEEDKIDRIRNTFLPFEGKHIRRISYLKVDLYEGSVDDTARIARSMIGKTLNTLHINTRENVLQRYLQFEEGQVVHPDLLADSERMLRLLSFIDDARIYVVSDPDDPETVDIKVVTKDRFSVGVEGSLSSLQRFQGGIYDNNFLGQGIEMGHELFYNGAYREQFGYRGRLHLNSIGRSLTAAELDVTYTEKVKEIRLRFDRGFFTPEIKYGGGIEVSHTRRFAPQLASDGFQIEVPYKARYYDTWAGRSFQLPSRDVRTNLSFALRYLGVAFEDRPPVSENDNFFFHRRNFVLGNITFIRRKFYRSRNFTGFGDTEDIPTGFALTLTGGYDQSEFHQRPYAGIDLTSGAWLGTVGYLGLQIGASGFLKDRQWEDGLLAIRGTYFSHLLPIRRFKFRQLLDISYLQGIRRITPGDAIHLKHQLRNYPHPNPSGQNRLVAKVESVLFAPWSWYGFRTAFFAFADMGYLTDRGALITGNRFYSSFGAGVRLRNRSLIFQTIELRLAYLPKVQRSNQNWFVDYRSDDPRLFLNLHPTRPHLPRFGE